MGKGKLPGMKTKAVEFSAASFYVADYRMADQLAMNTQLIRPARDRLHFDQGRIRKPLPHPISRLRMLAVGFHAPMLQVIKSAYGRVDHSIIFCNDAVDEGKVALLNTLLHKII